MKGFKDFFDSLKIYNTQAKLKNFKFTKEDIEKQAAVLQQLTEIDRIKELKSKIDANTTYLSGQSSFKGQVMGRKHQ
ncbi:MAG: DUF6079 family protein [Syntrophaceticus schinkii]